VSAASGCRLGAGKNLRARVGLPFLDLGPREHQGSGFCRFLFSALDLARSSPSVSLGLARFPLVCDLRAGQILSSCVWFLD
jgi:hypothetical protein